MAVVLLLASLAVARQGTVTLEPARDVRQFDAWIYSLMDSAVCETCVTQDSRGILHRVWADSGRMMYQNTLSPSPLPSPQRGEGKGGGPAQGNEERKGLRWSQAIRLSSSRSCESPLVFERRDVGEEPWLVVMWREEFEGRAEVMCRYLFRDAWPLRWGPVWNVTIRKE
jgi:hypothetical protein